MTHYLPSLSLSVPATPAARGFSLLELIIALAIVAILSAIAIPSFSTIIMKATLASQARELLGGAVLARSEAIKRSQVVTLCASNNGTSCTDDSWASGWLVIGIDNRVLHKHKALPQGYLINAAVTRIKFNPSGLGATMANLTICRATPTVGNQERVVTVSATGRASISKTETSLCASPL